MKTYEKYLLAILGNPEWLKSVNERYGHRGTPAGAPEIASAVYHLHQALAQRFEPKDEVVAMGGEEESGA